MSRSWGLDTPVRQLAAGGGTPPPAPPVTDQADAGGPGRLPHARRGLLAAAVGAALLVGVGGYVVGRAGGSGSAPATPVPPVAAAPSPSSTGRYPLGPSVVVDPHAGLTAAPAGVSWQLYQGVYLPYSATAGPASVHGAVASGFARTPTGALLAAVQTEVRYYVSPTPEWKAETLSQVLPGPGRDTFLRLRATIGDDIPQDGYAQVVGFRFVTYSPDVAVVELATRLGTDQQLSTLTVRWVRGDWRLVLEPNGSATPAIAPLPSLAGLVPWSGV